MRPWNRMLTVHVKPVRELPSPTPCRWLRSTSRISRLLYQDHLSDEVISAAEIEGLGQTFHCAVACTRQGVSRCRSPISLRIDVVSYCVWSITPLRAKGETTMVGTWEPGPKKSSRPPANGGCGGET